MLNDIKSLEINLENPYQIIMGTNGSGKSSLLQELSPLPAIPTQYTKVGYKYISISHRGSQYILVSDFSTKHTHSYKKDGIELNESGTITIQRDLVLRDFNLNDQLFSLIIGKVKFTQMTPSKRREYITMMNDNNLDYAISVFKELATRTRDAQANIKYLQGRIAQSTTKLISITEDKTIDIRVKQLTDELTILMKYQSPHVKSSTIILSELKQIKKEVDLLSDQLKNNKWSQTFTDHRSLEDYKKQVDSFKTNLQLESNTLDIKLKEYDKLNNILGTIELTDSKSLDELYQKQKDIKLKIDNLYSKINKYKLEHVVHQLYPVCQDIKVKLTYFLLELPINENRKYSRSNLNIVSVAIDDVRKEISSITNKINKHETTLAHMIEARDSKCPKCGYIWKEGVSEDVYKSIENQLGNYRVELTQYEKRLNSLLEYRQEIVEYSNSFSRLKELVNSYPGLSILVDDFIEDDRLYDFPKSLIADIDIFIKDININLELKEYKDKLILIEDALSKSKLIKDSGISEVQFNLEKMYEEIQDQTSFIKELKRQLKLHEEDLKKAIEYTNKVLMLDQSLKELKDKYKEYISNLSQEYISKTIEEDQKILAVLTQKVHEQESLSSIIDDLKLSLSGIEDKYISYKRLCKAISPTDGLIATQLIAFIKCLTDQMNNIISEIYTYNMEIYPCGIESIELNYKFPLHVGHDIKATDVSDGSDGQREIIDFAFRLVAMMYMDYKDYPLYLDELGQNQDQLHLENTLRYIKMLMDSHSFEQLFMISHQAFGFGEFNGSDILVLNPNNITVPQRHNSHAHIL